MKNRTAFISVLALITSLIACYPLTVGSIKWRITWDKKLLKEKKEFLAEQNNAQPDKPNVIILLADDLGKYEVSSYGAEHISTPHIDQIGAEGVVFEEGYVTAPTCAPSRAGIMTGRVQNRYGFETQLMEFYPTNMIEFLSGKYLTNTGDFVMTSKPVYPREWQVHKQGVPPTEINLAEILKSNGYATGITGKWHLGSSHRHAPEDRGFDYQYGFHGAFSWFTPEEHWTGVINHYHESFSAKYQWQNGRNGEGAITENGKEIREEQYLTFAIRDKAIDYIEENKDNPFFLYCAFSAPHVPFQAPVDYYCMYDHVEDENKRVYYAMISALDDAIGSIHQKVKELGIEDNTIIYFLSDNGGASYTGATDNGPLKGGKLMQFEGGINVPFMMKWKGHIPEGIRYANPVSSTDIFATSVINSGGELPARDYDGVDLLPYLNGENTDEPHRRLFWRADHIWAMRDGKYKMILSIRDGWAELYNLETDKSEEINLIEEMPELFEQLKYLHQVWQNENLPKKPMWPRIMDHKFIIDGKEYLFPA